VARSLGCHARCRNRSDIRSRRPQYPGRGARGESRVDHCIRVGGAHLLPPPTHLRALRRDCPSGARRYLKDGDPRRRHSQRGAAMARANSFALPGSRSGSRDKTELASDHGRPFDRLLRGRV
jgi:hypothetical protein